MHQVVQSDYAHILLKTSLGLISLKYDPSKHSVIVFNFIKISAFVSKFEHIT